MKATDHLLYLKDEKVWYEPAMGITMFWNEFRKIAFNLKKDTDKDFEFIWRHRDLKSAKEKYITSIVAKAFEKQNPNEKWWLTKTKQDPPDGVIGTIKTINGISKIHVREIEIVENFDGDLINTIKNKLRNKNYEENVVLVCFISTGGFRNFLLLHKLLVKENISLAHIFFAFHGAYANNINTRLTGDEFIQNIFKITLVQVKPVYAHIEIDPLLDCEDWRTGKVGSFYLASIGKGGESKPITLENPPMLY